jgi:hypothetical protein
MRSGLAEVSGEPDDTAAFACIERVAGWTVPPGWYAALCKRGQWRVRLPREIVEISASVVLEARNNADIASAAPSAVAQIRVIGLPP